MCLYKMTEFLPSTAFWLSLHFFGNCHFLFLLCGFLRVKHCLESLYHNFPMPVAKSRIHKMHGDRLDISLVYPVTVTSSWIIGSQISGFPSFFLILTPPVTHLLLLQYQLFLSFYLFLPSLSLILPLLPVCVIIHPVWLHPSCPQVT